jgi:hypothetical protein
MNVVRDPWVTTPEVLNSSERCASREVRGDGSGERIEVEELELDDASVSVRTTKKNAEKIVGRRAVGVGDDESNGIEVLPGVERDSGGVEEIGALVGVLLAVVDATRTEVAAAEFVLAADEPREVELGLREH